MKDNNKKIINKDKYLDDSNDYDDNNNNLFVESNKKDDSLEKYFKPLEDNHESDDILKQLENLNLSEEKSFEIPQKIFEPLAEKKTENIKINNSNKKEKKRNKYYK